MPLLESGTVNQLAAATRLDHAEVGQALQQLVELSLVQVKATTLQSYRYSLHSLTQTFLLTEALRWKQ